MAQAGDNSLDIGPLEDASADVEAEIERLPPSTAAKAESDFYAESKRRDVARAHKVKDAILHCARIALYCLMALLMFAIFVWVWHLLMPDRHRWLSPEELQNLQSILLSGALTAAATSIGRRVLI